MNGFTKYVLRQLFVGMILVTSGLTCIIWLSQSLRFIEMIVNRGLTAGMFLYLTMLLLPNLMVIVLPIALFTVVVFTYSKLITDRELVVMRVAGLSQFDLAKPALILALLVMALGYTMNLKIVPQSYSNFRDMQWDIRYNYSHILLKEGTFNQIGKGITVYVRQRTNDGQLKGIMVHDQRDPKASFTLMARKGAMVNTKEGARVLLFNGNRQSVDKTTHKMSILYFDRYTFDLPSDNESNEGRFREPRERSLEELFNIEKYSNGMNAKEFGKFIVEGHRRLVSPLANLGFTLIGLACLLSGSFSRRSQSYRVALAVTLMVAIQGSALGLESMIAKNLGLVPLLYLHGIFPIILGYFFMVYHPRRRSSGAQPAQA